MKENSRNMPVEPDDIIQRARALAAAYAGDGIKLPKRYLHPKTVVLPWEVRKNYERLRLSLHSDLKPEGTIEEVLVEHIAACIWQRNRLYGSLTGQLVCRSLILANKCAEEGGYDLVVPYDLEGFFDCPQPTQASPALKDMDQANQPPSPEGIFRPSLVTEAAALTVGMREPLTDTQRIGKSIEDTLYRAMHELQRLQAVRRASSAIPQAAMDLQLSDISRAPSAGKTGKKTGARARYARRPRKGSNSRGESNVI